MPLFVLNPVASAVAAAPESVTVAFAECVFTKPVYCMESMFNGGLDSSSENLVSVTCASPMPSPIIRITFFGD